MAGTTDPLADLRHDLCTPINQILGYSELLEEVLAEGEAADPADLRKIQQAARTMLALVRSRLTAAVVQGGDLGVIPTPAAGDAAVSLPGPRSPEAPASRPGRILAVDDDALNLDLLAQRLSRQGHVVSTAVDGEEARRRRTQKTVLQPPDRGAPSSPGRHRCAPAAGWR